MNAPTQPKRPPKRKLLLWILLAVALVVLGWSLSIAWSIYSYAQLDETMAADAAIVLGAGTRPDRPSPVFRERIDHAIDLYRRGLVQVIILTGGVGPGRQAADSEIARDYAIQEGVPDEAIHIETSSQTTLENLEEAKLVMEDLSYQTALIVSDPLHMYRALAMAQDLGLDARPSPTPTTRINSALSNLIFLAREVVLVMQYSIFVR
ncbi:MAG: YdcF family protein [Anaerolineales bacterium]